MIVTDLQPPSIVEDKGFKNLMKIMDGRYHLPSRRTIMRDLLPQKYQTCVNSLLITPNNQMSISLTTDFWTSRACDSYITITFHFINDTWDLQSYTLKIYKVIGSHTGEKNASELKEVSVQWNIEKKITCAITDNASNMALAIRITTWQHLPCFAHTLNLIVHESLATDEILNELRRVS